MQEYSWSTLEYSTLGNNQTELSTIPLLFKATVLFSSSPVALPSPIALSSPIASPILEPDKLALVKSAASNIDPLSTVSDRSASFRLAPVNLASLKLAPLRLALSKLTCVKSTPLSWAFCKSTAGKSKTFDPRSSLCRLKFRTWPSRRNDDSVEIVSTLEGAGRVGAVRSIALLKISISTIFSNMSTAPASRKLVNESSFRIRNEGLFCE